MAENDIEIKVKLDDQASGAIKEVNKNIKSVGDTTDNATKKSKSALDNLKSSWVIAGAAVAAMVTSLKSFVDAQSEAEQASAKLATALKNQGIYSQELQNDLEDYASALQKTTIFEDDQIKVVQARLVTAGLQGDALKEVTKLTLDFAAATGTDVESASVLFQKAATGNVAMLARYGIDVKNADGSTKSFSEAMAELQKKYGGFSEALAQTPTGKLIQLKNTFGDFKEVLGKVILEAIEPLVSGLVVLLNFFQTLPSPIKSFIGVLTVLGIIAAGLIPVFASLGIAINVATLGIPALVAGFVLLVANIDKVAKGMSELPMFFKIMFAPLTLLINLIKTAVDGFMKLIDLASKIKIPEPIKKFFVGSTAPTSNQPSNAPSGKGTVLTDFNKSPDGNKLDLQKDVKDFEETQKAKTSIAQREIAKRIALEVDAATKKQEIDALQAEMALAKSEQALVNLDAFHEAELQKYAGNQEAINQIDQYYAEQKLKLEEERIANQDALRDAEYLRDKQRMTGGLQDFVNMLDIKKRMTKSQAQDFAQWQSFMAGAEQSKNQEVAALAKAMAIYDIGLKTANAAISAYSALAGIPIVGPALGIGAAAAAIAYGTEQASKVASMQPALAEGGMVRSQVGGQSVTVAEGGKDEAVVPLDDPATAQRIQQAAGSGGQQVVQLVVDGVVLAETVVQGYNKGINIGTVTRLK